MTGIRLAVVCVAVAILIGGCGSSENAVEKKAPRHGVRIVLQADLRKSGGNWTDSLDQRREVMRAARLVILARLKDVRIPELKGMTEPAVETEDGKDTDGRPTVNLVVELPGVKDTSAALAWIRQMATLEFYYMRNLRSERNPLGEWNIDYVGDHYVFTNTQGRAINSETQPKELLRDVVGAPQMKPILTGADLETQTKVGVNSKNQFVIEIKFNSRGTREFAEFTRAHGREYLAIFYDGKLLTCPIIEEPITDGSGEVSGFATKEKAKQVADLLNAGSLPVPLKVVSQERF